MKDVRVPCPKCGRDLPPIPLTLSLGAPGTSGEVIVNVDANPGRSYGAAVRLSHPWCFGGKDDMPTETVRAA